MTEQIVVLGLGGGSAGNLLLWAAAALGVVLLVAVLVVIIRPSQPTGDAPPARPALPAGEGGSPRRRKPRRGLIALAAVLLLVVVAGGAVLLSRGDDDKTTAAAATAVCPAAKLKVAAAPEIAPVVEAAARTLASAGADCGPVQVTAQEPAAVAAATAKPDVWIPSSSAWLRIAATNGAAYDAKGASLAYSPIVLAAPESIAPLIVQKGHASWAALVDGVAKQRVPAVSMPDPLQNTIGMLSVYAVRAAMDRTTPDDGLAELSALTLRSRLKDADADPAALLRDDATTADPATAVNKVGFFPTTEQQLQAYGRDKHSVTLTGAVPADGVVEADYPYAVSTASHQPELADQLRAAIKPEALTAAGFRTAPTPGALPLPQKPDDLLGGALQWSQYKTKPFQVLLLVDQSGSMNEKVTDKAGAQQTKAALLRESGAKANQLFGEDTSIGLWYFSTPSPSSPAHTEAVPLGPLTGTVRGEPRRTLMGAAIAGYRATDGAGTPLYQTVLDGMAMMRAHPGRGAVNLVIVLTDGQDEQSRFAMSQQAFLARLKSTANPNVPIPIIAVGYGADADMTALNAMARATGGKAIAATDPADLASGIAQAFLAAHAPQ